VSKAKYRRVVLKVSGEGLCVPGGGGFDESELKRLGGEIKAAVDLRVQIAVVVGGGNFIRGASLAGSECIQQATAHYMGMLATVLNGLALQDALESMGLEARVQSALAVDRVCEKFDRRRCLRHMRKGRVVILTGGTGNPYVTTDTCAAQRAVELGADVLLKATKVDGVYSADPVTNPGAKLFRELSYEQVIGERLAVMDLGAFDLCRRHSLPIVVFNLRVAGNVAAVVCGQQVGTTVGG
jgi:uridylate kinase